MNEKSLEIPRHVPVNNDKNRFMPAKRFPQYVASLSSTLGALAGGMVLAWTSSAGSDGEKLVKEYGFPITATEFSWMGSLSTLGAAVFAIPVGMLTDVIGRKTTMLLMVVPFTVGWLLIILSKSVIMFCIGRFINGIGTGGFSVGSPMYAAEIAENDIRGRLGSYFQLLLTIGMLLSYALGSAVNMLTLSIISAIVPLIFFAIFFFMPESPTYYLMKGKQDAARNSLIRLYGQQYDIEGALQSQLQLIEEKRKNQVSFSTMIKSKVTVKGFLISCGLMFFQQFSGVNVIVHYGSDIFSKVGGDVSSGVSMIILGTLQAVSVFASTIIVDRLGRRILLLSSIVSVFLTTFALGVYFHLMETNVDVNSINWLPLLSLCIFFIMYSIGFGPLPWMMMAEIFAPEVKAVTANSAGILNAVMAFLVTRFYSDLKVGLGVGGTFWLFSGISAFGIFFVYMLVPETKGKSLENILRDL